MILLNDMHISSMTLHGHRLFRIYIKTILSEAKTIAVVGASSKKDRDSYKVMYHLIENGYKVFQ